MLNGYITAIVTPFKSGKIDFPALEKYINHLEGSGISGIVVCGSTGEALALSMSERIELMKAVSAINAGKIPLIGGIIDATTDSCFHLMKEAEKYVDYFLCICPFYIKPSQQQIYEHYKKLSNSTARGIILYNNPSRGGVGVCFDTFRRICDLKNVVAMKECAADLARFTLWRSAVKENFDLLAGNDEVACGALAMGASGVVSVTANAVPDLCAKMFRAFKKNNLEEFGIIRDVLAPLHELLFTEPSPAPIKYILSKLGLLVNELRAPLSPISMELQTKMNAILSKLDIV
ncbi:MAG: 4-hydroxy-tetrahydrodipicolinate synthase [Holosporaceae bacterium]|jgi:4-hydroxy-tetrahydrodipicolinate synthase|nr:4-hydroxy-tetrahydrodipicolinate synthase [Holosporaceae bacterium]